MLYNRTNLIDSGISVLALIFFAASAAGQQPVIRGAIIIQQNGQEQIIQVGPQGVFRGPVVPRRESEPPVYPEAPPLPSRPPIEEEKLNRLIFQLSSDSFRERVEATRELKTGGVETVRKLAEVLHSNSPEAARRAFSILEELFLCEDDLANEAADDALSSLLETEDSPLAARAEELLQEHALVRTVRAIRELELLGAKVEYNYKILEVDDRTGELIPNIQWILFDRNWTGGVEGLKLLSRVDKIGTDDIHGQIYYVLNCPVGQEDFFAAIKTWTPQIDPSKINIRGAGQLGIRFPDGFDPENPGVVVTEVGPGSAAAEAEIQKLDVLIRINNVKLTQPYDLIEELKKYVPGDEVEITLQRETTLDGEKKEMTKKVKLKGWTDED